MTLPGATPSTPRAAPGWAGSSVLAIGHSTRTIEEFVSLLRTHGVRVLADIRTIPKSRHNPQFAGPALARALAEAGIRYVHLPRLGGLRRPRPDSPNGAWRNSSFRGFADYMASEDFAAGLEELRDLARRGSVAIMCAEAVPWRCHRSLVADALLARGVVVGHIGGPGLPRPHRLTPFAVVSGRRVTYPSEPTRAVASAPERRSAGVKPGRAAGHLARRAAATSSGGARRSRARAAR